jgi:hypothetical protein
MFSVSCTNDQKIDFTELPIHPEAIDPQHFSDSIAKGVISLTYKVKTPFPASELIKFMEDSITGKGFTRYSMEGQKQSSFTWTDFDRKSGKWKETENIPARYLASWTNDKNDEIIWIMIDYSSVYKAEDWENMAHVSIQIAQLSKFKEDMEKLKKLTYNKRME